MPPFLMLTTPGTWGQCPSGWASSCELPGRLEGQALAKETRLLRDFLAEGILLGHNVGEEESIFVEPFICPTMQSVV